MASTILELVNQALVKLGNAPITSFAEPSPAAAVASLQYASCRDSLLSVYPWHFATKRQSLVRLLARPIADFDYAYNLPQDFIRLLKLQDVDSPADSPSLDFRLINRRLHCQSDAVSMTYIFRAQELSFPPYFDQALVCHLAREFALSLSDSPSRAEIFGSMAEKLLRQAERLDAESCPTPPFQDMTLIGVRN